MELLAWVAVFGLRFDAAKDSEDGLHVPNSQGP